MNGTSVLLCVPPISRRCGKRLTFEYSASKGLIWGFWRTTRFINPLTMCGYAAHWIWQLIRGRSSTPYIKATRKQPSRRCRRCNGGMPNGRLMAEMIQMDWKKIGVQAKILSPEWGEYLARARRGEHDAIMLSWVS